MKGGTQFTNLARLPSRILWAYFVILWMRRAKIYPYTKFEVASFTRSKFTQETHQEMR